MEVKECRRSDATDRLEKITNLMRDTCCYHETRQTTVRDTSRQAMKKVVRDEVILNEQIRQLTTTAFHTSVMFMI